MLSVFKIWLGKHTEIGDFGCTVVANQNISAVISKLAIRGLINHIHYVLQSNTPCEIAMHNLARGKEGHPRCNLHVSNHLHYLYLLKL
jgi:hypothetical protein